MPLYTFTLAVVGRCEDDDDARDMADVLGNKLRDSFDVLRVRVDPPSPTDRLES